jgi:hypothetical protein
VEILTTGLMVTGIAAICAVLILRINPAACETTASVLLSLAAAHKASRQIYSAARQVAVSIEAPEVKPQIATRIAPAPVRLPKAALRAGER